MEKGALTTPTISYERFVRLVAKAARDEIRTTRQVNAGQPGRRTALEEAGELWALIARLEEYFTAIQRGGFHERPDNSHQDQAQRQR